MKRRSVRDVLEHPREDEYYVLVTRYYPRMLRFKRIKLEDSPFSTWDRDLAPSPGLLKDYKKELIDWNQYTERYLTEVPPALIKRKGETYKEQAKGKQVVFVCQEEDWEYPHCHTWLILDVLTKNPVFKEVRFLKDVPSFVGADMYVYGPFKKGRKYALPVANANLLIKQGVAVDVRVLPKKPTLKELFKGEVLTGYVEAGRVKPLTEFMVEEKEREEMEAKEPFVTGRRYKYGCPFCRDSYNDMFFLKQHITLQHPEEFTSWNEEFAAQITRALHEDLVIEQIVENCKFWKSTICKEETMLKYVRIKGVENAKEILDDLVRRGIAYRPRPGYVGLTEPEKYGLVEGEPLKELISDVDALLEEMKE